MVTKNRNSSKQSKYLDSRNSYQYFYFIGGGIIILFSILNIISYLITSSTALTNYLGQIIWYFPNIFSVYSGIGVLSLFLTLFIELVPLLLGAGIIIIELKRLNPKYSLIIGLVILLPQILWLIDPVSRNFLENPERFVSGLSVLFSNLIPGMLILIGVYLQFYLVSIRKDESNEQKTSLIKMNSDTKPFSVDRTQPKNYNDFNPYYYYIAGILTILFSINYLSASFRRIIIIFTGENFIEFILLLDLIPILLGFGIIIIAFKRLEPKFSVIIGLILFLSQMYWFLDTFLRILDLLSGKILRESQFRASFIILIKELHILIILLIPGFLILVGLRLHFAYLEDRKSISRMRGRVFRHDSITPPSQSAYKIQLTPESLNLRTVSQEKGNLSLLRENSQILSCKHNDRPKIQQCFICGRHCCYECSIEHLIDEKIKNSTNGDKSREIDVRNFCPVCYIDYTLDLFSDLKYRDRLDDTKSFISANNLKIIGILIPMIMLLSAESINRLMFKGQSFITDILLIFSVIIGIIFVIKGMKISKSTRQVIKDRFDRIGALARGLDR